MFFLFGLPDGAAQLPEGIHQGALFGGDEGSLPVASQQGNGAGNPPQGGNQKGDDHGASRAQAEGVRHQHQNQARNEGNHGADVAEGEAHGGHLVHPLVRGDLRQHGVVEDNAGGVANPGQNEQAQEGQPARGEAQHCAACHACQHGHNKELLFHSAVCQCAANGAENGYQNGGDGAGVAPVAHVKVVVQPGVFRQGVKENGNQRGHQQNEGGIAHIVENPAFFQRCEFEFFLHFYLLPSAEGGGEVLAQG